MADARPRVDRKQIEEQLLKSLDESTYRPPPAFAACVRDAECVVASSSCASSFAVNRAHLDEAKAAAERLCTPQQPGDVLDVPPIPACRAGRCVNAAHSR